MTKKIERKPKRETPQVKGLKTRVKNLTLKLADSVPKAELEAMKGKLEAKVKDFQSKLTESIANNEETKAQLSSRIRELEEQLSESKAELEVARNKIKEIESMTAKPSEEGEPPH